MISDSKSKLIGVARNLISADYHEFLNLHMANKTQGNFKTFLVKNKKKKKEKCVLYAVKYGKSKKQKNYV